MISAADDHLSFSPVSISFCMIVARTASSFLARSACDLHGSLIEGRNGKRRKNTRECWTAILISRWRSQPERREGSLDVLVHHLFLAAVERLCPLSCAG